MLSRDHDRHVSKIVLYCKTVLKKLLQILDTLFYQNLELRKVPHQEY